MRKLARRGLSFVLSFLMVASTAYADVSFIANAEEQSTVRHVWTKVSLSDITSSDSIAITMTTSDGKTYVLPNAKATSVPKAIQGTVDGSFLTIEDENSKDSDYSWTISKFTKEETVVTPAENEAEADTAEGNSVELKDDSNQNSSDDNKDTDDLSKEDEVNQDEDNGDDVSAESDADKVESKSESTDETKDGNLQDTTSDDISSDNTEQQDGTVKLNTNDLLSDVLDEKAIEESKTTETKTYTYYTISNGSNYLYTIAKNDGIRVSTKPKDEVGAQWSVDSSTGYLCAKDSKDAVRYLGVYTVTPDWRGYTNTTGNTKGQTLGFYKLTTKVAGSTIKASIESGETVDFGTKVSLSCDNEKDKIYYNVNGSENNFSPYEEPIEITGDTTIYAKTMRDEEESETVSFNYTLAAGSKITDLTKLSDKQEFVLTFGDENVMSTTANKSKLNPIATKLNDDKHLTYSEAEAPIAKLSLESAAEENQYYFTTMLPVDGVYTKHFLTTGATGNNLTFEVEKNEYSVWELEYQEDDTYLIKNAKAQYKGTPQYLEYYSNLFTAYSYTSGKSKIDAYKFTAYTYPEMEVDEDVQTTNTVGTLLTRELYDGDQVVIYYPESSKVMTTEANNGRLKDAELAVGEDGKLDIKGSSAAVLTISLDENGYYSFKTQDGKYLTGLMEEKDGKTYANLVLADEKTDNSLWSEEATKKEGKYYLKNTFAKLGSSVQALEYYNGFSLYGFKESGAYEFSFYALEEGEKKVSYDYDDSRLTIAQWAGNAHYDEVESAKEYIYGDIYETNDMLDKTAIYTVVVNGKNTQPWTSATSSTTGSTSFYMGSTGVASSSTDYMQLEFPTEGYGNLGLEFRMRASNTAAGSFQMQYSTDGENFKNLKTGTYSFKYTAYKANAEGKVDENGKTIQEPFEVNGSGDITDGIAKTSYAPTNYVTFTFDIPNAAANAKKVYIRLVPGDANAKGNGAPAAGGVIRIDGAKVKGNPIVDAGRVGFVVASPSSGEISKGQKITLTSKTEGADIYYSVNGGEFVKYDDSEKLSLSKLPASVSAYATKEGLEQSITVKYQYTQAQVAAVKATPNGGAVLENQRIALKSKTDGATILYRYLTEDEIKKAEEKTTALTETEGGSDDDENNDDASEEIIEEETEEHDDWIVYEGSFELKSLPSQIQVKAIKDGYKDSAVSTVKFTKKLNDKYNIYFGQIHAHTDISDGAGSLEDALKYASNVDNLDYIVITDHSNSIDNEKISKISENVDTSETDEWTYAHNLVKKYSTDKFTCAYGYEMTWSNGLGHMNTYNTAGFQSRTQTEFSTYSTALQNYYAALRTVPDSISQFNHPGTTFGDFSDFAYYTEENDNLITMIEVGNGEGTIGSSGYFPSYEYYTRALDKGWHVAPTNNQDNHKGKWGDANTARTVMLADTNDENAIYDAMRNYRIYATEDNDLSIYYTLNNYIMGTILEKDAVDDTVEIKAIINDPTDSKIGKVEVIVNGGQSIAVENLSTNSDTVVFNVPSDYSYYYLKITESDGDIAVTAPVWVGEVEACGINSTYTNSVLPVKGESLDINVDLFNNESAALEIENINITLSDVDGNKTEVCNLSGEKANITSVAAQSTATFKTDFVYEEAGKVTYEVRVDATLNGVKKVYTDKLIVSYTVPAMVTDVIIDGTHYNDYVTGYYGGNISAFISLCAKKNIRATVETTEITPEMLESCALLVLSAPAKKSGTANAGDYTVSHYSDDFLSMVKDYVSNGGSVIVCGLADYSDTSDCQTATEQNKLLEAVGSTIKMGSDEVCDDVNNGGQVYRMYPTTFNVESGYLSGLRDGQKYSQYSGCSVDISNAVATDFVDEAQWLVKGFDTTYSVDCKSSTGSAQPGVLDNGVKGIAIDNKGNVTFLAAQHTKAGGNIFVAGGVFVSDFEVKAEMDNNDSLPYTNYTIANNILDGVTVELPTSTIAEARAGKMNEVFAVEGYVTSGTANENTTFFDTIYIQDETAGTDIFPYAEAGLEIGTKMRIVGYVSQYQGDKELKVISYKILDDDPYVWDAKEVDTKTAMDYDALGGSLLKTSGKVTRVAYGSDGKTIEEFWLADDTGVEAAIFIDGYIYSGTTGKNELRDFVKEGAEVSAIGVLYMHPEGDSDVSVPVFRVRDCDDIVLVQAASTSIIDKIIDKIADKIEEITKGGSSPSSESSSYSGTTGSASTSTEKREDTTSDLTVAVSETTGQTTDAQRARNTLGRGNAASQAIDDTDNSEVTQAVEPSEDVAEYDIAVDSVETVKVEDSETPLAANEENSIPVVPIAVGFVIILAGALAVLLANKKGFIGRK